MRISYHYFGVYAYADGLRGESLIPLCMSHLPKQTKKHIHLINEDKMNCLDCAEIADDLLNPKSNTNMFKAHIHNKKEILCN